MPAQQGVGLDNVQGLLPEAGAAGQQHQTKAVTVSQLGTFDLATEYNELLTEHRIFGDEVSLTAGDIGQGCDSECDGGWLDPLFNPVAEIVAETEKVFEHTGMVGLQYLVHFSA